MFDDDAYREHIGQADDFAVAEALDAEITDCALSFLQLRAILQEFPNAGDWEKSTLRELYEEAARRTKPEVERPARTVNRVTLKEFEQLADEKRGVEARCGYLEREAKTAAERLAELERENADLRADNQRLLGRIEELERLASREAVGV